MGIRGPVHIAIGLALALAACGDNAKALPSGNGYGIAGSVIGLAGSGLTISDGLGTSLTITSDGPFVFPERVAAGTAVDVSVTTQPSNPNQTCTVTGGHVPSIQADLTTVSVKCVTGGYHLGGTISGLAGHGLVLRNAGGDALTVQSNGSFVFPTLVEDGTTYSVSVATQPSTPTQTCTISNGDGTIHGADVTNIVVSCSTGSFTVGGVVFGLTGAGLVLHNGSDNLTISSNGAFTFPTSVASGQSYTVTVSTQPTGPVQQCRVIGGNGTIGGANVTTIAVNCSTNTFSIGGTVSGLVGIGLVLQNNAGDDLAVSANGGFAFPTPLATGATYNVTIKHQPANPGQQCAVTNGSGTVASSDVSSVVVTCTTNTFKVGGTVSSLVGVGLVLQNNAGDNLFISGNGSFQFATSIASGGAYNVTVLNNPSNPTQTCTVANGSGVVIGADITDIAVTCSTIAYTIGGNVVGLAGSGLVLQDNGGDDLAITNGGSFTFATPVASGGMYNVTIKKQPSNPAQVCTVGGATGTVGNANVTSVVVNCSTNTYTIGGNVSGLAGHGLVLQDNGGDDLAITANGTFAFMTPLASGMIYNVTIKTQPSNPTQVCTVTNGTGGVNNAPVTTVQVTCSTSSYHVIAQVMGLSGSLQLKDNGTDLLNIAMDGSYPFQVAVASGAPYFVQVSIQPQSQSCTIANPAGIMANADVIVQVTCVTIGQTVEVNVSGYPTAGAGSGVGPLVLDDNGGDTLTIPSDVNSNSIHAFATPVAPGSPYDVTVVSSDPSVICTPITPSGTVGSSTVVVQVVCDPPNTCQLQMPSVPSPRAGIGPNAVVTFNYNDSADSYAVANGSDDTISVFLTDTNYDGRFLPQVKYSTGAGSNPFAIAAGDLNNDSNVDLVVALAGTNQVAIFFGVGDGTFMPAVTYATGQVPNGVAIGDFNNDQCPDLALNNFSDGTVSILLGKGAPCDGTLLPQTTVAVGAGASSGPSSIAVGDFDTVCGATGPAPIRPLLVAVCDPGLDLVVTNFNDHTVQVLLGNGDGTFVPQTAFLTGRSSQDDPVYVVTGDLDNNGKADLVVANLPVQTPLGPLGGNDLSLFFGNGDGTFSPYDTYPVGDSPLGITLINDGGNLDIATSNFGDDTVSYLFADGGGDFEPAISFPGGAGPVAIANGDFTDNCWNDLVVADFDGNDTTILTNNCTAKSPAAFIVPPHFNSSSAPVAMAAADFNADNFTDAVLSEPGGGSGSLEILKNDQAGNLASSTNIGLPGPGGVVATGDVDGSNGPDVVVAIGSTLQVFINDGSGNLSPGATILLMLFGNQPSAIVVRDVNSDGFADIVVTLSDTNTVVVLLSDSSTPGQFLAPTAYTTDASPNSVSTGFFRLGGPGGSDFAVGTPSGTIDVFLNDGSGNFSRAPGPQPQALGNTDALSADWDFNVDEAADLVAANSDGTVSVLLGNNDGTFRAATTYPAGLHPTGVVHADFDNDGTQDLAVSNEDDNTVSILFGNGDGTFQPQVQYPAGSSDPIALANANFYQFDNFWDLYVANGTGGVTVLRDNGGRSCFIESRVPPVPHRLVPPIVRGDRNRAQHVQGSTVPRVGPHRVLSGGRGTARGSWFRR